MNHREIDDLIHEKVMKEFTFSKPKYSTEMTAAMTVVNKLLENKRSYIDMCRHSNQNHWRFWISVGDMKECNGCKNISAQSFESENTLLSEAICITALKTVGIDV